MVITARTCHCIREAGNAAIYGCVSDRYSWGVSETMYSFCALYCSSVNAQGSRCKLSMYLLNMGLCGGNYDINFHIWCGSPFTEPSVHPKILARNSSLITRRSRCEYVRTMSFASMTSILSKKLVILEESYASNGVFCMIKIAGNSSHPALSVIGRVPKRDMLFRTESVVPKVSM